ncbi:hypothetical protein LR002_02480 [Candidatus Gracilibacteria bacterium]|nr:hypothetical protein [Candidatus Gracilibacteria bacterium]
MKKRIKNFLSAEKFFSGIKNFFLVSIFFFGIFFVNSEIFAGDNILEIQFSNSDAGLVNSFSREQGIEMEKRGDGADSLQIAIMRIVEVLVKFMGFFAFIYLFYTGISLVINGSADELAAAKSKILWTIAALLMTFLIEPLVRTVFFGGSGTQKAGEILNSTGSAVDAAKIGVLQIEGLIGYIETFVILIALVMMIKSAVSMIFAHDSEVKLKEQKDTILWTGIGLVVILFSKTLVYFGVYGNGVTGEGRDMGKVVAEVSGLLNYILGFLASIAVAMIIYGGAKMIFSGEEEAQEGKAIIKNVIIGSIIISVAYVLVTTLVGGRV